MRKELFRVFIGSVVVGAASSCGFYHAKAQSDSQGFSQTDVSYAGVNSRIFSRQCIACHNSSSAKAGVVLDNYDTVKANLGRVEDVALIKQSMPPSHPLDSGSQQLLRAWITAGAPQEGPDNPTLPPLEPKFSSIRTVVFETRCISCHTAGGTAEKVPLVDYTALLGSPRELVLPGNAEESGLILALDRTDDNQMPPKNSGIRHLSEQDISAIKTWIQNGAKDD